MRAMLNQFFSFFAMLFSAGEQAASALNELASAGNTMAATVNDEARHDRTIAMIELEKRKQLLLTS